jgi:hypothetical protein
VIPTPNQSSDESANSDTHTDDDSTSSSSGRSDDEYIIPTRKHKRFDPKRERIAELEKQLGRQKAMYKAKCARLKSELEFLYQFPPPWSWHHQG